MQRLQRLFNVTDIILNIVDPVEDKLSLFCNCNILVKLFNQSFLD